jgi:uncharacterized damage-inducible protein DinB
MAIMLVDQLRFARSEFVRCFDGVSAEDALLRIMPLNSLGWRVGHMASHEYASWLLVAQGKNPYPDLYKSVGTGKPASTPPLDEMWRVWREVTREADIFLETLTPAMLTTHLIWRDKPHAESIGTMLLHVIYHYFFHIGEAHANRQILGHTDLPDFIGEMLGDFEYRAD